MGYFRFGKSSKDRISECQEATDRMIDDLERMRTMTESSALEIGELLTRIVAVATEGNQQVQSTLEDALHSETDGSDSQSASISDLIQRPTAMVEELLGQIRTFFDEQLVVAKQASLACDTIRASADEVTDLAMTSQVLSINLKIEAARLGNEGRSFMGLGTEVQEFAKSVQDAAGKIRSSTTQLNNSVPRMQEDTIKMERVVESIAGKFEGEMATIGEKADALNQSLQSTADHVATSNQLILDCSNDTLSKLAFQDPVSQGLERIEHDIQQLLGAATGAEPDFTSLAELKEDVGEDGSKFREAGEIELF